MKKFMKKLWLLFSWNFSWAWRQYFGDRTSKIDFFCQAGEHTFSNSDLEKDGRSFKRIIINGKTFFVYKGIQKCLGTGCEVTRRVWQEIYQDPEGKAHPGYCKELTLETEKAIDKIPHS